MELLNIEVRPMTITDMPSVMEIENLCFKHPWGEQDILYELNENPVSHVWVIELSQNGQKAICGFCDYWETFDSATICQIAVHPKIQRHQLGNAMMDEIINDCYIKKIKNITLEVRASNEKAINFYKRHGFCTEIVKKSYYSDGEDALYMIKKMEEEYGNDTSN
ncbi:MAG: ribosomal protein S18-alanine N-acetyltransferase [Bacilli bacterium]|nr:ribosomal protein S18-alanine N-acetyltransferase [Bacilli bacterium]